MKRIALYGSRLCHDTVETVRLFNTHGISYEYFDINENMDNLRTFLRMRDHRPEFAAVREGGGIGIPCIIVDNDRFCFKVDNVEEFR